MKERRDSHDHFERRPREEEDESREQETQRHLMEDVDVPPDDGVVRDRTAEREISEEQMERQQLDTDYDLKPSLQKQAKDETAARETSIPMGRDIANWPQ